MHDPEAGRPYVIDERDTAHGRLVLRRIDGADGADFEIVSDGMFLMDTRNGDSERRLVSGALGAAAGGRTVLIGGLGAGFSLAEALRHDDVERVTVVELHAVVVEWNRRVFDTPIDDPRVRIVEADLVTWLDAIHDERFDAVCLDVDNGPSWLTIESNGALYASAGLERLGALLADGGVLAFWSAAAAPALEAALRSRFATVWTEPIAVPRGEPDVVVFARDPVLIRPAAAS